MEPQIDVDGRVFQVDEATGGLVVAVAYAIDLSIPYETTQGRPDRPVFLVENRSYLFGREGLARVGIKEDGDGESDPWRCF